MTYLEIERLYKDAIINTRIALITVDCSHGEVFVPQDLIVDGHITFDISPGAVRSLNIQPERIYFYATFNGKIYFITFPTGNVTGIQV